MEGETVGLGCEQMPAECLDQQSQEAGAQGAWPGEQQRATGNTGGRFHEQAFWDRIFVQQGTTFS